MYISFLKIFTLIIIGLFLFSDIKSFIKKYINNNNK